MFKFIVYMQNYFLLNIVIIDCIVSVKVVEKYYDWMQKCMYIIILNKKVNLGLYEQVRFLYCVLVIELVFKVYIV